MKISFEFPPGKLPQVYSYDAVVTGVKLDGINVTIRLTIDEARRGRGMQMAFSAVKVEAHPGVTVTTSMLRDLPLQKVRQEVTEKRLEQLDADPGEDLVQIDIMYSNGRHLAAEGPSERNLDIVGQLYMTYEQTGAPVKAVMEYFGISRSTATRWVRLAENTGKFGYLRTAGRGHGLDQ